jgi:hypothetical protein
VEVNSMRQYLEHFSYQIANIKLKALHAAALP